MVLYHEVDYEFRFSQDRSICTINVHLTTHLPFYAMLCKPTVDALYSGCTELDTSQGDVMQLMTLPSRYCLNLIHV